MKKVVFFGPLWSEAACAVDEEGFVMYNQRKNNQEEETK